jgi:hypothetical protein
MNGKDDDVNRSESRPLTREDLFDAASEIRSQTESAIQAVAQRGGAAVDSVATSARTEGPIVFCYTAAVLLSAAAITLRVIGQFDHVDLVAITVLAAFLVGSASLLAAFRFRAHASIRAAIVKSNIDALAEEAKATNERLSDVLKRYDL